MFVYSFANSVVLVNGQEITGWADGDDVIKATRRVDSASDKMGAGGSMMVSLSTDKSGEFEFNLQIGSPSNAYLNDLVNRQEAGADTFVPVAVLVQDTYRQDRASGTTGYMKKQPDYTRGAVAGNQVWVFVVESLDMVFGDVGQAVPQ